MVYKFLRLARRPGVTCWTKAWAYEWKWPCKLTSFVDFFWQSKLLRNL